jgi:hypothetical protein
MTKDKALKLAKAWFERNTYGDEAVEVYEAIEQALAAPVQEPDEFRHIGEQDSLLDVDEKAWSSLVENRGGCRCHIAPPCGACSNPISEEELNEVGYTYTSPPAQPAPVQPVALEALILKTGMNPVMQGICYVMHPEALQAVIDEAVKQALAAQLAPVQPVAMTFDEAWASLNWQEWRMKSPQAVFRELHRLTTPPAQPAPVQDSTCSETLRAQGKAYPRTCRKCGKGPCIGAPKQPPAAPVQEPKHYRHRWGKDGEGCVVCGDKDWMGTSCKPPSAAPMQEPVACKTLCELCVKRGYGFCANTAKTTPIITTPPAAQRQWVGLTEQEAAECWSTSTVRTWQAIEAKLKEKNNG